MSKPSPAQIDASRANGKHSRGPNTAHGKQKSCQNALRHGLAGRIVVLPTEDMAAYQAFSKELVDSLHPETPMERQLAQAVADSQWRLNRARSFEDGIIALGHFEAAGDFDADSPEIHSALTAAKVFRERSKDFVNLSLYEQRIQRGLKVAFDQLRQLQAERKAAAPEVKEVRDMRLSAASAAATAATSAITPVVSGFVNSDTKTFETGMTFTGPLHPPYGEKSAAKLIFPTQ